MLNILGDFLRVILKILSISAQRNFVQDFLQFRMFKVTGLRNFISFNILFTTQYVQKVPGFIWKKN